MTNEDAIRWLDNLKNDIGNPHYERLWHYAQAIDEICYLLKEQQPMLIDVNQMKQHDDGTDVWLEAKDGEVFALTVKRPWIGFYFDKVENGTYRCWTARPTDEQRKSVPWVNT